MQIYEKKKRIQLSVKVYTTISWEPTYYFYIANVLRLHWSIVFTFREIEYMFCTNNKLKKNRPFSLNVNIGKKKE